MILTILAIAWAVTTITVMLAVGEGLRTTFSAAVANVGRSFLVVSGGQTASTRQGQQLNQPVKLTEQDLQNVQANFPGLAIIPEYSFSAQVSYQGQSDSYQFNAVTPEYSQLRLLRPQSGGRFIDITDIHQARHVVVLGYKLAETLAGERKKPNSLLGETIFIDTFPFQVIGVLISKLPVSFYQSPDDYLAWIPASTYVIEKKPQEIDRLLIFPHNLRDIARLKQQLVQIIARTHALDPHDQNILFILDIHAIQEKTHAALLGLEVFLGLIGAMTLAVAGIGIVNVMFISVRRATRDIGMQMALGARSGQILWRYIFEALATTLIGGILGIVAAYGLVAASRIALAHVESFYGKPVPVLSFRVIFAVIILLGLVGLVAGLLPARRAASINPAEALRYE